MSGHSKWSKIKHKKALTDAKKSKVFSKLVRFIEVESKKAGGDVESPGVRLAIERARAANMPSNNINRAIAKGKEGGGANMENVLYEAYGPGGSAIIIEGLTDSRNRTAAEIKYLLNKHGTQLAAQGAAAWAFEKVDEKWSPKTVVSISEEDGEKLMKLIEELEDHDDVQGVYINV
ncbi:MAG: YebC/PmpR family DNA-binding transcriptional regulator [Candidatus Pacebacteria bacterium]|jgi:YebC/PmpR family DNA-binding regulatory protein|nr:YebC/PmpR family DNA-binding transcriptional regulator [Candidatus Paceibacterota bacterium]|tara:strand:+ start:18393 stop:18920 length:528 start_codon:yes stop_codon:yes gene_type:complete